MQGASGQRFGGGVEVARCAGHLEQKCTFSLKHGKQYTQQHKGKHVTQNTAIMMRKKRWVPLETSGMTLVCT
eukprot:5328535-Amphidinium_carterae.2